MSRRLSLATQIEAPIDPPEPELDEVTVCAHCKEDVEFKTSCSGDDWEGWSFCPNCEIVEPDTTHVFKNKDGEIVDDL